MNVRAVEEEWEESKDGIHWDHTTCGTQISHADLSEDNALCPGCGTPVPQWLQETHG